MCMCVVQLHTSARLSCLVQVLEGLRMVPVDPTPALTLSKAQIGRAVPLRPGADFAGQADEVLAAAKAVERALQSE